MQVWDMYKSDKLRNLVQIESNSSQNLLEGEAVRFAKVGLLCVQENSRLRPIMSKALRMMNQEINIDDVEVSPPALINNIMDVKIAKHKTTSLHHQSHINTLMQSPESFFLSQN